MNEWGIYKITFPNNKCYIGLSCNLKRRISEYKNWKHTTKQQTALYNAFNKYGFESVKIEFLYKDGGKLNLNKLDTLEKNYIKLFNSKTPMGYNLEEVDILDIEM